MFNFHQFSILCFTMFMHACMSCSGSLQNQPEIGVTWIHNFIYGTSQDSIYNFYFAQFIKNDKTSDLFFPIVVSFNDDPPTLAACAKKAVPGASQWSLQSWMRWNRFWSRWEPFAIRCRGQLILLRWGFSRYHHNFTSKSLGSNCWILRRPRAEQWIDLDNLSFAILSWLDFLEPMFCWDFPQIKFQVGELGSLLDDANNADNETTQFTKRLGAYNIKWLGGSILLQLRHQFFLSGLIAPHATWCTAGKCSNNRSSKPIILSTQIAVTQKYRILRNMFQIMFMFLTNRLVQGWAIKNFDHHPWHVCDDRTWSVGAGDWISLALLILLGPWFAHNPGVLLRRQQSWLSSEMTQAGLVFDSATWEIWPNRECWVWPIRTDQCESEMVACAIWFALQKNSLRSCNKNETHAHVWKNIRNSSVITTTHMVSIAPHAGDPNARVPHTLHGHMDDVAAGVLWLKPLRYHWALKHVLLFGENSVFFIVGISQLLSR